MNTGEISLFFGGIWLKERQCTVREKRLASDIFEVSWVGCRERSDFVLLDVVVFIFDFVCQVSTVTGWLSVGSCSFCFGVFGKRSYV